MQNIQRNHNEYCTDHEWVGYFLTSEWTITTIFWTVTFLPVDSIFFNTPVANTCHTSFRNGCTTTDNLAPPSIPCKKFGAMSCYITPCRHQLIFKCINIRGMKLTNKSFWSLLRNFHTEWSWCAWFIAATFNGYVLVFVKSFVGTTVVFTLRILSRGALITSYALHCNIHARHKSPKY